MKAAIRIPFFEIGIKNYAYGDKVLELAQAAEEASLKYDIDVFFISPYTEIRRVAENCRRLIVLAPYMDTLRPGRGIADILPEAVKAAGAKGVVINHCERPMSLSAIKQTIERANELDLLSFACADSIAEARAIAQFHPDIINPEPTELIGSDQPSSLDYVMQAISAVKAVYSGIIVEQAAGISNSKQVYDFIFAGAEGAGMASGIFKAPDPVKMINEAVASVRWAFDDRKKSNLQ
jgi:triosephosphate isomerase